MRTCEEGAGVSCAHRAVGAEPVICAYSGAKACAMEGAPHSSPLFGLGMRRGV